MEQYKREHKEQRKSGEILRWKRIRTVHDPNTLSMNVSLISRTGSSGNQDECPKVIQLLIPLISESAD